MRPGLRPCCWRASYTALTCRVRSVRCGLYPGHLAFLMRSVNNTPMASSRWISLEELQSACLSGHRLISESRRFIEADHLNALINSGEVQKLALGNVSILGQVNLTGTQSDSVIALDYCSFEHSLELTGASLSNFSLQGSSAPAIRGRGLKILRNISLAGFRAWNSIDLRNCDIAGDLTLLGAHLGSSDLTVPALFLLHSQITGSIDCRNMIARNSSPYATVNFGSAQCGGTAAFGAAILENRSGPALSGDLANCASVSIDSGARITGHGDEPAVSFNNLTCRSSVILSEATITSENGAALRGVSMTLGGSLVIRDESNLRSCSKEGAVRIISGRISGALDMRDSTIVNSGGASIEADALRCDGGGAMRKCNLIARGSRGAVVLKSARFGSQLEFQSLAIECVGGPSISLDQSDVQSSLHLQDLYLHGDERDACIRIVGAEVGGQLNLHDIVARFELGTQLVKADYAKIDSTLIVDRIHASANTQKAAIDFTGARISGQADFKNIAIANRGGAAIRIHASTIGESVQLLRSTLIAATEAFNASTVVVRDYLQIRDTRLVGLDYRFTALQIQFARVGGALRLDIDSLTRGQQRTNLVDMDGIQFGIAPTADTSIQDWILLLRRYTSKFSSQPYQQLAEAYRRAGHSLNERTILIEQELQRGKRGRLGTREKLWNRVSGLTLAYGYKPSKSIAYVSLICLLATTLTLLAPVLGTQIVDTSHPQRPACGTEAKILLSLEISLPLIGTGSRLQPCAIIEASPFGGPSPWHYLRSAYFVGSLLPFLLRDLQA